MIFGLKDDPKYFSTCWVFVRDQSILTNRTKKVDQVDIDGEKKFFYIDVNVLEVNRFIFCGQIFIKTWDRKVGESLI